MGVVRSQSIQQNTRGSSPRENSLFLGLLFGNLVVFPFGVTIYDEISCLIFLFFTIRNQAARALFFNGIKNLKNSLFPALLVSYLIIHAIVSCLYKPSVESLKWLFFYILLSTVYLAVRSCRLSAINGKLIAVGFAVYSMVIILLYFVSEFILGVNFFNHQSNLIAGTTTYISSYVILFYYFSTLDSYRQKFTSLALFFLAYYSIYLSDSRLGFIMAQFLILWLCIKPKVEILTRIFLLGGFILTIICVPLLHEQLKDFANQDTLEPVGVKWEESPNLILDQFSRQIVGGVTVFINPRTSDMDRRNHLSCAINEFKKAKIHQKVFGFGTSEHRILIGQCFSKGGGKVLSTSISRLLLDYGATGLVLYLIVLIITCIKYIKSRDYFACIVVGQFALLNYIQDQGNLILMWLIILCPKLLSSTKSTHSSF